MDLAMFRGNGDASVAREFAASTVIECFEGESVLDSRVGQPFSIIKGGRVVEANLVVEVGNMICWRGILGGCRAVMQDALDWTSIATDVGKLAEAVFWDVVLGDGERVIIKTELGDCRYVSGRLRSGSGNDGVCERDCAVCWRTSDNHIGTHKVSGEAVWALIFVVPRYENELSFAYLLGGQKRAAARCVVEELDSDLIRFLQEVLLGNEEVIEEALNCVGGGGCCASGVIVG